MAGMFNFLLPVVLLIGGAFSIFFVSRLFHLSNRIEALLTVLVLLGVLLTLILVYLEIPDLLTRADAYFGWDHFEAKRAGSFYLDHRCCDWDSDHSLFS